MYEYAQLLMFSKITKHCDLDRLAYNYPGKGIETQFSFLGLQGQTVNHQSSSVEEVLEVSSLVSRGLS